MTKSITSFIGTAGWRHLHWRDRFYPQQLPSHSWLNHYSRELNTVELDAGRLINIDHNLMATWRSAVPTQFRFTVQAPRLITHVHKLRNCASLIDNLRQQLQGFEGQLGAVLFSLPARWHCNLDRLEQFLSALPGEFRYAFEFHDPDWLRPETFSLLREHAAALCLNDRMPLEALSVTTSDFVYVRLYGPSMTGRYNSIGLRTWATRVAGWRRKQLDSFVMFQNDALAYGAKNACLLRDFGALQTAPRQTVALR